MNHKGFTLIEVLIVISLTSIVLLALLGLFDWHNRIYYLEQAQVMATGGARTAMNHLEEHIAQARAVTASRTINGTLYTSSNSAMVLQMPAISDTGSIVPVTYDYIVYYVSGTGLYELVQADAGSSRASVSKQLTNDIDSFSLTYNNADLTQASTVTVDLQTRVSAPRTHATTHVRETILLRNH